MLSLQATYGMCQLKFVNCQKLYTISHFDTYERHPAILSITSKLPVHVRIIYAKQNSVKLVCSYLHAHVYRGDCHVSAS